MDEFAAQHAALVEARAEMLRQLQARAIHAPLVLQALAAVPRERFLPRDLQEFAYADRAWPIDCGQTISQPLIVAMMTQALELSGRERVLEIGTGSGYQTAILAELAAEIVTVERFAQLSRQAHEVLDELGYRNITFVIGDGARGWPEQAPYDRIIAACAAPELPPALFDQLQENGILVLPIGDAAAQSLYAIRKIGGRPQATRLSAVRFVPMVSGHAAERVVDDRFFPGASED